MGNEDDKDTQKIRKLSLLYRVGDDMCIDHIINGASKIDKTNHRDGTTRFEKVKKRDEWVRYPEDKARKTQDNSMVNMKFDRMIKMINAQVYIDKDIMKRISDRFSSQVTQKCPLIRFLAVFSSCRN